MSLLRALVVLAACCSGVGAAADTWIDHSDARGFRVVCPAGWKADATDPSAFSMKDASGSRRILIIPLVGQGSQNVLKRLIVFFPGAHLERNSQPSSDRVLATYSYHQGSTTGRADVLIALMGRGAMLYAVAAPEKRFRAERPDLLRILTSFKFAQPHEAREPAGSGGQRAQLQYEKWSDPHEGAFSIEAPRGWKVQGGLIRRNALDPRQTVDMISPDGLILVRIGDATIPGFVPPSPALTATGFRPGSVYSIGGGINYIVSPFQSGAQFGQWYLHQRVGAPYSDMKILSQKDRPDLAEKLHALVTEGVTRYVFSVGEVDFSCSRDGAPMSGACFGVSIMQSTGGFNVWGAGPVGFVAPSGKEEIAKTALRHALASWHVEEAWMARQSQTAMQVSNIATRSNAEISKDIDDSFWSHRKAVDDVVRKKSNEILGLTDLRDPQTGQTFTAAAGHNYYFLKGGQVVGNDSGDAPDIDFRPLQTW